ncbi:MAG: hypothetical protein U0132_19665 [Gemmatimonadaceae bacterium]
MRRLGRGISLGVAWCALSAPLMAQVHGGHTNGFGTLGGTRPDASTLSGFGSLRSMQRPAERMGGYGAQGGERMTGGRGYSIPGASSLSPRFSRPWGYPVVVGTAPSATVTVPVPVPYYVPVPVPAASSNATVPAEPPPRYDPTRSRMTVIGKGADGGGGVMRIDRLSNRSVRLTWLANERPTREATLFLADANQQPLAVREVDLLHREAVFILTEGKNVAYTGLTVVFKDGASRTTLVPFADVATPSGSTK